MASSEVSQAAIAVVAARGDEVMLYPDRFRAALLDELGENAGASRSDVEQLLDGLIDGVPTALQASTTPATHQALVSQLVDRRGLSQSAAEWVVASWGAVVSTSGGAAVFDPLVTVNETILPEEYRKPAPEERGTTGPGPVPDPQEPRSPKTTDASTRRRVLLVGAVAVCVAIIAILVVANRPSSAPDTTVARAGGAQTTLGETDTSVAQSSESTAPNTTVMADLGATTTMTAMTGTSMVTDSVTIEPSTSAAMDMGASGAIAEQVVLCPGIGAGELGVSVRDNLVFLDGTVTDESAHTTLVAAARAAGKITLHDSVVVGASVVSPTSVAALARLVTVLATSVVDGHALSTANSICVDGTYLDDTGHQQLLAAVKAASDAGLGASSSIVAHPVDHNAHVVFLQAKLEQAIGGEQIPFETASAVILPGGNALLDKIAAVMKRFEAFHDLTVTVEGHTDSVGQAKTNVVLSQQRADSVRKALVARGVKDAVLKAVGYGSTRPIADNATASGRAANRRVVFTVDSNMGPNGKMVMTDTPSTKGAGSAAAPSVALTTMAVMANEAPSSSATPVAPASTAPRALLGPVENALIAADAKVLSFMLGRKIFFKPYKVIPFHEGAPVQCGSTVIVDAANCASESTIYIQIEYLQALADKVTLPVAAAMMDVYLQATAAAVEALGAPSGTVTDNYAYCVAGAFVFNSNFSDSEEAAAKRMVSSALLPAFSTGLGGDTAPCQAMLR